jgi:hypothetical protein
MKRAFCVSESVPAMGHLAGPPSPELWRTSLANDRGVLRSRALGRGEGGG